MRLEGIPLMNLPSLRALASSVSVREMSAIAESICVAEKAWYLCILVRLGAKSIPKQYASS